MSLKEQNVRRLLRHLGLEDAIFITSDPEDESSLYGWPDSRHTLFTYAIDNQWEPDLVLASHAFHGSALAMRESGGVRPAFQIYFFPFRSADARLPYYIGIDLDEEAPSLRRPHQALMHGFRALKHTLTGTKTSQEYIAKLLDKRIGPNA